MVYAQASSLKDERELKGAVRVLAVARKLSSHPFLSPRLYSPICAIYVALCTAPTSCHNFPTRRCFLVLSTTCNTNVKRKNRKKNTLSTRRIEDAYFHVISVTKSTAIRRRYQITTSMHVCTYYFERALTLNGRDNVHYNF